MLLTGAIAIPRVIKRSEDARAERAQQAKWQADNQTLVAYREAQQEIAVEDAVRRATALRRRELFYSKAGLVDLDAMGGVEFETFLRLLFGQMNYSIETTKVTGDFGADLILARKDERVAVQAKRWSGKS
ncbi:MAG: restriction endonuclease [Candidatus Dormibacteria bacterium]